jgi:beta-N-acetylhexosaminidase
MTSRRYPVLVAGYTGSAPPPELERAAREGDLAGFILFRRNVGTLEETGARVARLLGLFDEPPLVCVDQEGGRVARLGPPVVALPPARVFGDRDDPSLTRTAGHLLGSELAAIGFNVDFAPVLDVDTNPENPVIGDRSYGRDPTVVVRHARAFAEGLEAAGLMACGKHFPGHGDTDLDSHLALPRLTHDRRRLDEVELAPFRALATMLPSVMTAHVVFDALAPNVPATLSHRVVTELLKGELGFEGLVVSDDLEMKAVRESVGVADAAVQAIEAGCDTLLVCSDLAEIEAAREALARAAERSSSFRDRLADAAQRTTSMRRAFPPRPARDPAGAIAALSSSAMASRVASAFSPR